jgi:hypothetical protein
MITIYANWSGHAMARGQTLAEARAKLTMLDCDKATVFGNGPADLTALDTGPHETILPTRDKYDLLSVAREFFAVVSTEGPGRLTDAASQRVAR